MPCHENGYPVTFDQGLAYTRFGLQPSASPYPSMIGSIQTGMPLMDVLALQPIAEQPWGAGVGNVIPAYPEQFFTQTTFPAMPKIRG